MLAKIVQRSVPTVALVNKATVPLGVDIHQLADALYRQVKWQFGPIWGIFCRVIVSPEIVPGAWCMMFSDDADAPGALGYHDLTPEGLPLSKVFVKTTVDAGQSVSVTASHEILEMLIDPAINLMAAGPNGDYYAYEVSDACEEETYKIGNVEVSDFVFPSYFEGFRKPGDKFDWLGKIRAPFTILPGGYMPIMRNGKWTQIFGSIAKAERFALEDRREHRSEFRKLD